MQERGALSPLPKASSFPSYRMVSSGERGKRRKGGGLGGSRSQKNGDGRSPLEREKKE